MVRPKQQTLRQIATLTIILLGSVEQAIAGQKVALVIGNSQYQAVSDRLANPVNDARAVAAQLQSLGYDTQTILNANLTQMLNGLNALRSRVSQGGTVVFYYAGHGVQLDERNYLVPVDASMQDRDLVARQTLSLQEAVAKIDQVGAQNRIVILDACRNDPFPKTYRSGTRGLTREPASNNTGTMIMYAASPNEVADDGRGQNGVFTNALLKSMQLDGLPLPAMMDDVRTEVRRQTNGKQNPYYEGTGLSRFMFVPPRIPVPPPQQVIEHPNPHTAEIAAWNSIKSSNRASDYQSFLRSYPSGLFTEAAQLKLNQLSLSTPSQPSATATPRINPRDVAQAILNHASSTSKNDQQLMSQGMWRDPKTNMIWMRCSLGQTWDGSTCTGTLSTLNWQAAQDAIKAMNRNGGYGGYTDWVVPHIEDLASLIRCNTGFKSTDKIPAKRGGETTIQEVCKDGSQSPTIDQAIFPNTPTGWSWSASPVAENGSRAWLVGFNYGGTHHDKDSSTTRVRAVRAGYEQ